MTNKLPINQILVGDCLKVMPTFPDESIDLIFTDPPYGISSEVTITRTRNPMKFYKYKGKDISLDFGDWDKFKTEDEFWNFTFAWVDEVVRVLRKGGMFCTFFDRDKVNFISKYLQDKYEFKCKGYFAWIKSNPVPQARKVKWMNAWEIIGMWQKQGGKLTYNYKEGQHPDYVRTAICGGKERLKDKDGNTLHPTQKPEKVIEPFIKWWSNPNDIVLDPFCGTGTTLFVAKKYNRRYIGIEVEKRFVDAANKRLDKIPSKRLEMFFNNEE